MEGYLHTQKKEQCFGCESCVQICNKCAITMQEDKEGFRYPIINKTLCVQCGQCNLVCPYENMPQRFEKGKYVFGGYSKNPDIRFESTSGGAFSAIVDAYCDKNYVIFGAKAKGLLVFHDYVTDKKDLKRFRKSKYIQSIIGTSYKKVKKFLDEGKKVVFSGTPCQIAALKTFLKNTNQEKLLTIEVVCEGVPSPLYIRKYEKALKRKYKRKIESLDYRYTSESLLFHGRWDFEAMKLKTKKLGVWGKWDFQVMRVKLVNKKKEIKVDRWFNPFWSIWINHLMSRPSCYQCPFANQSRVADILLGDLWGVHLYCPELYGNNGGTSLIVTNTEKGKKVVLKSQKSMYGHELRFEDALKYQGPMRNHISSNPNRKDFMLDLQSSMCYEEINSKWAKRPTIKLLLQKYLWGNRQKIALWKITKGKYKIH